MKKAEQTFSVGEVSKRGVGVYGAFESTNDLQRLRFTLYNILTYREL